MTRIVALALFVCTAVCGQTFAQGGELEVFPQAVEINFPQGYDVYSDAGKLLKTVPGPTFATIRAKTSGKVFAAEEVYLSDWSYDQLQQGKTPNWIVPKGEAAATAVSQVAAPSGVSAALIVYPTVKEVSFPEGYSVFSDNGQLIKTVPGPTSIALKGETSGKTFANGTAYLSDWSYDQLQQGKEPKWVVGLALGRSVANGEIQAAENSSPMVHFPPKVCFERTTSFFSEGYDLLTNDGQLIKTVNGSASAETEGYSEGLPFARGRAYLAHSSINRILSGQAPVWIRDRETVKPALTHSSNAAASFKDATEKMVRVVGAHAAAGRTKDPAMNSGEAVAAASRGMTIVGASHAGAKSTDQEMLYPDPVPVTFPYGYEVYDGGGRLLESVSGPKTHVLRGKIGEVSVSEYKSLDGVTTLDPESIESRLGTLSLNCTVGLNHLGGLDPETASEIVAMLNSPQMGSKKGAEALGAQRELQLNGLESLSPTAAAALANFGANSFRLRASLSLKGVKSLDPASAKALLDFAGPLSGPLFLNWSDGSSAFGDGEVRSDDASRILFLSEDGYEAIRGGKQATWIAIPKDEALYYPIHSDKGGDPWRAVDTKIADVTNDESDPWTQIDEVNGSSVIYDIVTARHPATRRAFAETGASYRHTGFGNYWQTFQIDGFSHSPELASGNLQYLGPATFDALAIMTKQERDWLNASLPATYQAIADIFRNDFLGSKNAMRTRTITDIDLPKNSVFLRFYRSPFVPEESAGDYLRWGDLDAADRQSLTSGNVAKRPSFYGVQVYVDGEMAGDYPLFGAVDLEAFAEIMLRNYTKRKAGLDLDSTDEWLQGFFESIYRGVFGRIKKHLVGAEQIYWQAEGYFHLIPLDLIAVTAGAEDGVTDIPMIEVTDAAAASKLSHADSKLDVSKVLLVANPEFDSGSLPTSIDREHDTETARLVSRAFNNRSLSFTDLPGADAEITSLSTTLGANGSSEIRVLRKNEATESEVVRDLKECTLAHVATHGFYLDMTLAPSKESEALIGELKNSPNPYFRSGVALVGANSTLANWSKGKVLGSSSDGILLASEIREMDLRNVKLLVLSACSTAEGKPVDGKSVASLRDAFLQAGVETLLSTLWDIPDDFSAKLMGDFYSLLVAGDSPALALWKVKKENFLELRKTNGFTESMIKVAPFVAVTQGPK